MSFSHTITVLDFTAQIGLYALAQLSGSDTLTTATQQRCWRQLALAHVAGAPLVDWHRPAQVGDLEQLQPDVAATAVLMGPGSIHLLLIRHGLLQSPDAVQLEPVEGLRHLSPSKVYE